MSLNLTLEERLNRTEIDEETGCVLYKGYRNERGYGVVWYDYKPILAHRLSYTLHVGEIPDGVFVLHSCGTSSCINPDHLRLGTHQENMDDRDLHGRTARGERNGGGGKLTEDDVSNIKAALQSGQSGVSLGRQYGVSKQMIYHIKHEKLWRDVKPNGDTPLKGSRIAQDER